jgi:Ni/Co efflux regulator RcnB
MRLKNNTNILISDTENMAMELGMKISTFISLIIAFSVTSSTWSFAQGRGNKHEIYDHKEMKSHSRAPHRKAQQPDRKNEWGHDNLERDRRWAQRGAGPNHQFRRGDRLPMEYRHSHYVVNDWHNHDLTAPPRGYHWVQSGGDYILVAVTTGLILQILVNH